MGWKGTFREVQAAERQRQRDAQRHLRELERRAKERAKLSTIEQARLEVETYENRLEVLLSVHKEQGDTWDWIAFAATLPPPCPQRNSHREIKARQRMEILPPDQKQAYEATIDTARQQDEQEFQDRLQTYSNEKAEWEKLKTLSCRILAGEPKAYTEVLSEFSPFAEISDLGSSIHFTVHSAKLMECELKVNGTQAIPAEVKTLTTTGKVSVKPMPKSLFHETCQDYLCGCVLRVAREVFALLPLETLLITALADTFDPGTGKTTEQPVLSAAMSRRVLTQLDFGRLDPSDAMDNFVHRGDFKASRKSGTFVPITPLTPADITPASAESMEFRDLVASVQRLRDELRTMSAKLSPKPSAPALKESPSS